MANKNIKRMILTGLFSATLLLVGCGTTDETPEETTSVGETTEQPAVDETTTEDETVETSENEETGSATIKTMYSAPHGDKSFASTFVVMNGDTITDVVIDEYQFMEGNDFSGVPNDDATFGEGYAEEATLVSKLENDEGYSEMMSQAGSTVSYGDNLVAITEFAKGKTVAEIEAAISELEGQGEEGAVSDVVSGATLVDTNGYLKSIVDTANEGFEFSGVENADLANAELSYSLQAPHGEQAFAAVAVLHDGDTVLAASIDEFQFVDPADFEGVPNSDDGFGEFYNDDVVLASKMQNDEAYSSMMTEMADATNSYSENMLAVIDHAEGSTVEEIQATIDELNGLGEDGNVSDVVTGATFIDTNGYLQAIIDTMNK